MRHRFLVIPLVALALVGAEAALAQEVTLGGKPFVELSLRAISSVTPQDRRGARSAIGHQIALLTANDRMATSNELLSRLRANDLKNRNDVLGILATMPTPWSTTNTDADRQFIYKSLLESTDDTYKGLLDDALANAKGLYKDGIADFNSTMLSELNDAEPKLKTMAAKFPKSRYAERASYYLAQLYSKKYLLGDTRGKELLDTSNAAFQDYFTHIEHKDFDSKEYFAGGYFYRALNSWLAGNIPDARNWLKKGQDKFEDSDRVYVYQLFVSKDRNTVINKYFPAKTLFATTAKFLSPNPPPATDHASELISILQNS